MLFKIPYNAAKKHFLRKTEVQTHIQFLLCLLSLPLVPHWLPCCLFLSLIPLGALFPSLVHWTLLLPPLVLHPSLLPVFTSIWLPLTPSRHTHTGSSFSLSLTLISQGSTHVLLVFLLTAYFASGLSLSPVQLPHFFPPSFTSFSHLPFKKYCLSSRSCLRPTSFMASTFLPLYVIM